MNGVQRIKRVFSDLNACGHCGGRVRIVASIEEPTAIRLHRGPRLVAKWESVFASSARLYSKPSAKIRRDDDPTLQPIVIDSR